MRPTPHHPTISRTQDYYPYGMVMPEREYQSDTGYRYGFNGMEKDNETYGESSAYDFGARIYDSRLGRWMSVDPLMKKYTWLTPFCAIANNPILFIDIDGREVRLVFYGVDIQPLFNRFKLIIESKLNGFVKIEKGELVEEKMLLIENGKSVLKTVKYYKVLMVIDENAIRAEAIRSLPLDATEDMIQNKINEIKTQLENSITYIQLYDMINSNTPALYTLSDEGTSPDLFAGYDGTQLLDLGQIEAYNNVPLLGAYTVLLHSLIEGHCWRSQFMMGNQGNKTYSYSHLYTLEEQAKELGYSYMSISFDAENISGSSNDGGAYVIALYKKNNNKYIKTEIRIPLDKENKSMPLYDKIEVTNSEISISQFNKEKNEYKEDIKKND